MLEHTHTQLRSFKRKKNELPAIVTNGLHCEESYFSNQQLLNYFLHPIIVAH